VKLVEFTTSGLYCRQAGIYIDPWQPVDKALLTHAHSDHARPGSKYYLAHVRSEGILRHRLGDIELETLPYQKSITMNGVSISLHPAGHVQGSAQVRLEYKGEIWVISGDYKLKKDGLNEPFESVKCHHFVTESTFGLPLYKFPENERLTQQINHWVENNARAGFNSVIAGYALGKAQRILSVLHTPLNILLHTTIYNTNEALGFDNTRFRKFDETFDKKTFAPGIVLMPAFSIGSPWLKRFDPYKLAICSGWMQLRGTRRIRNADAGFVMSDHADWDELNTAVKATGAENVYVTHGYSSQFARWLREEYKLNAVEVQTQYEGEGLVSAGQEPNNDDNLK
jgi:putative mRNA 3-end processing factor